MQRSRIIGRLAMAALALATLSACAGRGIVSREYLLAPAAVTPSAADLAGNLGAEGPALGVGPVEFPDYLRRPQIVTRRGNQLIPSALHTWGGDLQSNFTRVLAENLSTLIPTDRVATFPWSDAWRADYRVSVQVSRFEGSPDGGVALVVYWRLLDRGNDVVLAHRSSIRESTEGSEHPAIVDAMSRAVLTLSREIAGVIREQVGAS